MSDLSQAIRETIVAQQQVMNTAIPAKVTRVDAAKGMVDAQPVILRKYPDGTTAQMPIITNVPLALYRAGDAYLSLPVQVGHYVLLVFSQRSLDTWLQSGGIVDAQDPRMFSLNDAVAYPGVYPFSQPASTASATDVVLRNAKGEVRVTPDGKFKITNGTNELVDLVQQLTQKVDTLLDTLSKDTVNTIFGPMKLNSFATYVTLKSDVDDLVTKVGSLKG